MCVHVRVYTFIYHQFIRNKRGPAHKSDLWHFVSPSLLLFRREEKDRLTFRSSRRNFENMFISILSIVQTQYRDLEILKGGVKIFHVTRRR